MPRLAFPLALLLLAATPVFAARDSLGIFDRWGAFRDAAQGTQGRRCFAIAEPAQGHGRARWRPCAAVRPRPARGIGGQVHLRLSQARAADAPVRLSIGQRRFRLIGAGADAWAGDRAADAAIIAAIRSGTSMSVESVGAGGAPFIDVYALRGAATAIDAAALGCAAR